MSTAFDPYYKWLGIPADEQPADHYRLLGLRRFESDAEVIQAAADRQMVHVRSYASGQHGELSQRLLNEIAAAKLLLLDPKKRTVYDQSLQAATAIELMKTPNPHYDSGKVFGRDIAFGVYKRLYLRYIKDNQVFCESFTDDSNVVLGSGQPFTLP